MSEQAQSFITYLSMLKEHDRGAFAHLKRGLGFAPGAYPPAYPYVERFVGADKHAEDPRRKALYLTAGLFALHPKHIIGISFGTAFGKVAYRRKLATKSESLEKRFVALLGSESESISTLLRHSISLLSADEQGFDYAVLLTDLASWLNPFDLDYRDHLRQRWARDFYRAYEPFSASAENTEVQQTETQL